MLQFLSSDVELVKGPLFLGTAVWWEAEQLAAHTRASSSWSPLNLLILKTLLALCFLLHTFPRGHYRVECLVWSHLNVYPQAQISLHWLLLCVGALHPVKGDFNELKRMLSKYFITEKLLTPGPGEPGTEVWAMYRHLHCPAHKPQTADAGGGWSALGEALAEL